MNTVHILRDSLTTSEELGGLVSDGWSELLCVPQVLEYVDIGGEEGHILLSTPIRHLQQSIQVLEGPTQDVPYRETWDFCKTDLFSKQQHYRWRRVAFPTTMPQKTHYTSK